MKVFVTGNRGQLGSDAMEVLAPRHNVRGMDLPELDIADATSIETSLDGWPEVIVNCAAYTNVDACESNQTTAWAVNAEGPAHLAMYAQYHNVFLVHVSTDYVFDGVSPVPHPYRETDPTHPVSAYGKSKLAGEEAIQAAAGASAIVRTSWLYGANGRNFLKTMLRLAIDKPDRAVKVVNDQYGCPTWSYRLAQQILRIVDTKITGTLHATGDGFCTWYELAVYFLTALQVDHRIVPCTSAEYPTPATRPTNSILENRRLREAGVDLMRPWREDVDEFVAKHHDALIAEAKSQEKQSIR